MNYPKILLIIFSIYFVCPAFFTVFVIYFAHTHTCTWTLHVSLSGNGFSSVLETIFSQHQSIYSQLNSYLFSVFVRLLKSLLLVFSSHSPPYSFSHVAPESICYRTHKSDQMSFCRAVAWQTNRRVMTLVI
jgi:hypothetical protein